MRIVQVIENFFPDSLGGTETYVLNISQEMLKKGYEVSVIAPRCGKKEIYDYKGIKVYRYAIPLSQPKNVCKGISAPDGIREFIAIIKEINPDIVHFHTFNTAVNNFHLKAVKELGIKTVFTPHQAGIFCGKGNLIDERGRRCNGQVTRNRCTRCYLQEKGFHIGMAHCLEIIGTLARKIPLLRSMIPASCMVGQSRLNELKSIQEYADRVIAISQWVQEAFAKNGIDNVSLVSQGVDVSLISNKKVHRDVRKRLRIIFVGRIYPIKSLETLCTALKKVDVNQIHLTMACVCGKDEYALGVKQFVHTLPNFSWEENVSHERLGDILADNDILVLPSISEMSPLVILEAFAAGIPVVASDIPPITDLVVNGENGLTFPVRDSNALAHHIENLLLKPELLVHLKTNVRPPRTFSDVSDDLLLIYNNLFEK